MGIAVWRSPTPGDANENEPTSDQAVPSERTASPSTVTSSLPDPESPLAPEVSTDEDDINEMVVQGPAEEDTSDEDDDNEMVLQAAAATPGWNDRIPPERYLMLAVHGISIWAHEKRTLVGRVQREVAAWEVRDYVDPLQSDAEAICDGDWVGGVDMAGYMAALRANRPRCIYRSLRRVGQAVERAERRLVRLRRLLDACLAQTGPEALGAEEMASVRAVRDKTPGICEKLLAIEDDASAIRRTLARHNPAFIGMEFAHVDFALDFHLYILQLPRDAGEIPAAGAAE